MIITADNNYRELDNWLADKKKVLLVCDLSIQFLDKFNKKLEEITVPMVRFSDFQPNPLYESVVEGVKLLREEGCDSIIAVGGGSAMDVAKCIKLYSNMSGDGSSGDFLKQKAVPNSIPFLAVPLICYSISYIAISSGIVPMITADVAWTTPVFRTLEK